MKTREDLTLSGLVHDLNNVFQTLVDAADLACGRPALRQPLRRDFAQRRARQGHRASIQAIDERGAVRSSPGQRHRSSRIPWCAAAVPRSALLSQWSPDLSWAATGPGSGC